MRYVVSRHGLWESNVVERGNIPVSQSLRTGWSGILDSRYDLDDEAIEMTCWLMNADYEEFGELHVKPCRNSRVMLRNQVRRVNAAQGVLKKLAYFVEVCQIAELGVEVLMRSALLVECQDQDDMQAN
jgi:hypothetical protein